MTHCVKCYISISEWVRVPTVWNTQFYYLLYCLKVHTKSIEFRKIFIFLSFCTLPSLSPSSSLPPFPFLLFLFPLSFFSYLGKGFVWPRLTLNSLYDLGLLTLLPYLPSSGITGLCYHSPLCCAGVWTQGFTYNGLVLHPIYITWATFLLLKFSFWTFFPCFPHL